MKEYIRSRIKMTTQFIIIVCLVVLTITKETNSVSVLSVAVNNSYDKNLDLSVIRENQKELYSQGIENPIYTFTGELTGYSGDCPLCSGYLACPPRTNVLKSGIFFDDKTYGKVRIVASSKKYPCGTILKFNVKKIQKEPIIAIVLDRGVGGNVIDLLTENEDYARKHVGRVRNLDFEVLREGWKKWVLIIKSH